MGIEQRKDWFVGIPSPHDVRLDSGNPLRVQFFQTRKEILDLFMPEGKFLDLFGPDGKDHFRDMPHDGMLFLVTETLHIVGNHHGRRLHLPGLLDRIIRLDVADMERLAVVHRVRIHRADFGIFLNQGNPPDVCVLRKRVQESRSACSATDDDHIIYVFLV